MPPIHVRWRILAAASVVTASLVGCNDNTVTTPTRPPPQQDVPFSVFATQLFMAKASSTPVSVDGINFTYDANDDPSAFDPLIMSGSF